MQIAIIGGGAAGFFSALIAAHKYPENQYVILEKTTKLLAKVRVSGGGRCNVTHACFQVQELVKNYPRGEKTLKTIFKQFMPQDMITWLADRGVKLKTETDGRIFPTTDNSETIINLFLEEAHRLGIKILTQINIIEIIPQNNQFYLQTSHNKALVFDKVIIATGGSPQAKGLEWLQKMGHSIVSPVPSLFTFNIPQNTVTQLMGIAVEKAQIRIEKSKLQSSGALLITHWGMSGPAVLKLSAWGARELANMQYQFAILVKWLPDYSEENLREELQKLKQAELAKRQIENKNPFHLPQRLWTFLLQKIAIPLDKKWIDLSKQEINRLINILINDRYEVSGKTTFKEEFVTCGGVALEEVDWQTMESKICKGLFFAGEVLDIDGITGGFNFQAAWSTAYVAGIYAGKI